MVRELQATVVVLTEKNIELQKKLARLNQGPAEFSAIAPRVRPTVKRNIRSNWDSYRAQFEHNHGPNKPLNPVEQDGVLALRSALDKVNKEQSNAN
jgi:hypothetical protein